MTVPFNGIDLPGIRQPAFPLPVAAQRRARGALRYRCPSTGSYVLLTDPAALAEASAPNASVRCPGCGGTHPLTQDASMPEIVRPRTAA